ncbi:MAG: hypothetical protein AAF944_05335 [Bacteroidota bacterium]
MRNSTSSVGGKRTETFPSKPLHNFYYKPMLNFNIMNKISTTMNTSKRWAWLTMLLIGILAIGTVSCNEDDDDNGAPVDPGTEVESAWLTGFRKGTPQGRLYYMEVNEEIPSETSLSNSIELGLNARIISYGEHPYTWNDNAVTLTKWDVNRTTLELSANSVMSFASTGITNGFATTFVSDTKAYVQNIPEGIIVEFNPTLMEITEVIEFDFPFPQPPNGEYFHRKYYAEETGKIIYTIQYFITGCCEYDGPREFNIMVFDTETNTVEFKQSQNGMLVENDLVQSDDGFLYTSPSLFQAIAKKYLTGVPDSPASDFSVLRMDLDGNIDPDYSLDLSELLSAEFARAFEVSPSNNVRPFIVTNNDFADTWDERFAIFNDFTEWEIVGVNYVTGEVTPITAFDGFNYVISPSEIDGEDYAIVGRVELTSDEDNAQVEQEVSYLVRIEDGFNITLLTRNPGGTLMHSSKLW